MPDPNNLEDCGCPLIDDEIGNAKAHRKNCPAIITLFNHDHNNYAPVVSDGFISQPDQRLYDKLRAEIRELRERIDILEEQKDKPNSVDKNALDLTPNKNPIEPEVPVFDDRRNTIGYFRFNPGAHNKLIRWFLSEETIVLGGSIDQGRRLRLLDLNLNFAPAKPAQEEDSNRKVEDLVRRIKEAMEDAGGK